MEKITKAFLSADISLYQLNNKHIKDLFYHIGHFVPIETTCTDRKTVLQLSADELLRITNAVYDKQICLVVDESIQSVIQYLSILVRSQETP